MQNYVLEDPEKPKSTEFIPPQDRISPSSVYYCRWNAKAIKFISCKENVALFAICTAFRLKKSPIEISNQPSAEIIKKPVQKIFRGYYCPMFCEGDKTYPENVGCQFVEWIW